MRSIKINQIGTRFARAIFLRTALFVKRLGRIGGNCLSESSPLSRRVKGCRKFNLLKFRYDKIAAIGLLMVLIVGIGLAIKPQSTPHRFLEGKIHINGGYPKVGEVFEVVYQIRVKEIKDQRLMRYLTKDYCTVIRCIPPGAAEIIGKDRFFFSGLRIGEVKKFRTRCKILKPVTRIGISGGIGLAVQGSSGITSIGSVNLYLLDSLTGQYGTKEEYEGKLPVVHRYDPVDGSFTCSPDQNPAPVEENRRIIKMIKALEPRLSDSLALLLHSDQYRVGIPKGLPRWDEEKQRWIEEEVFEYYLKDGWFEALRENRREEWLQEEKKKIESGRKEGRINFFRDNNSSDSNYSRSNNPPKDRITTTFIGQ